MMTESLKLVTTKDGVQIAIWQIVAGEAREKKHDVANSSAHNRQNILLTHGTFSDKQTCLRIAEYLAQLGHHCYIMEWRGHGHSSMAKDKFNFETVASYDFAATFHYLFAELKLDNLHCVTHSGGGACLTMFLIQNPHYIDTINSISLFACQVYGAIVSPKNHFKIIAAKLCTRLLGYLPAKKLNLGPINESYYTMNQWYDWNLNKDFKSSFIKQNDINANGLNHNSIAIHALNKEAGQQNIADDDRFDYRQHMAKITTPIYAISAKGDTFISPTRGCELLFNDFDNPANVFREYSLTNGDLDDYTHSRIMMSRHAAEEIWPTVAAWIHQHAG